jgi:hypothetical protein
MALRNRLLVRGSHEYGPTMKTSADDNVTYTLRDVPVRFGAILRPVSNVVATLDTLLTGAKLRVAVIPAKHSRLVNYIGVVF